MHATEDDGTEPKVRPITIPMLYHRIILIIVLCTCQLAAIVVSFLVTSWPLFVTSFVSILFTCGYFHVTVRFHMNSVPRAPLFSLLLMIASSGLALGASLATKTHLPTFLSLLITSTLSNLFSNILIFVHLVQLLLHLRTARNHRNEPYSRLQDSQSSDPQIHTAQMSSHADSPLIPTVTDLPILPFANQTQSLPEVTVTVVAEEDQAHEANEPLLKLSTSVCLLPQPVVPLTNPSSLTGTGSRLMRSSPSAILLGSSQPESLYRATTLSHAADSPLRPKHQDNELHLDETPLILPLSEFLDLQQTGTPHKSPPSAQLAAPDAVPPSPEMNYTQLIEVVHPVNLDHTQINHPFFPQPDQISPSPINHADIFCTEEENEQRVADGWKLALGKQPIKRPSPSSNPSNLTQSWSSNVQSTPALTRNQSAFSLFSSNTTPHNPNFGTNQSRVSSVQPNSPAIVSLPLSHTVSRSSLSLSHRNLSYSRPPSALSRSHSALIPPQALRSSSPNNNVPLVVVPSHTQMTLQRTKSGFESTFRTIPVFNHEFLEDIDESDSEASFSEEMEGEDEEGRGGTEG
ncbi:hypothetical protein BLNAU_17757 [Blattamonas nauphoetae]|uniref:Uncharacterized protein n=1 Tax=Blattamonas nauphoetae TaxID=2049346 RepID=A0ABQ9X683_9EUKA|nr:hypothetical protein BLNAU_17757 [Blattamonas nauphoetae]